MTNTMTDRYAHLALIATQLVEQGLVATVNHSGSIDIATPEHPEIKLWMSVTRGKGAFVRALGKRPFGLTAENLLKNPQGIAERVVEKVASRVAEKNAERERMDRAQPLVDQLNATGFEAEVEFDRVRSAHGVGCMRRTFDNTGVHLSVDVPAEKLAALKAFLDQLAEVK